MREFNAWDFGVLPGTECGAELEKLIESIPRDSSEKILRFKEGMYYIKASALKRRMLYITNTAGDREYSRKETPHEAPAALYFDGIENLTVDGGGAEFLISGKATNCVIANCENFVLKNFTIDTDKPDFHQLKIAEKGKHYVDFELDENEDFVFKKGTVIYKGDGFEADIKSKAKVCWWVNKISAENRENNVRARHPLATALKLKMTGKKTLRAYYLSTKSFNAGDLYYLFDNRRQYAGIFIDNSKNVTVENIAQHFNYSLAVVAQCSENIYLKKLDLTPKKGYFVTSVADFVQACLCRGEFKITDCAFDGAGDDCLNCHGFHFKVDSISGNKAYVKFMHPQSHGYNPFKGGDTAAFIDKKTLLQTGESKVISSVLRDETTVELTLSGDMPEIGSMLENASACPDLTFARNEIHRIVTRGLLITNRGKTVIEDNHFYENGMSGILLSDDASSWYESGMCTDVTVQNNTFDYCGEHGIMIKPENSVHAGAVHKNIRILNNTFKKCEKVCFYAKSSSDLQFIGNNVLSAPELIKTENCENVTVK